MGLKSFHYLFIALAILCTLSFGLWALVARQEAVDGWGRVGGGVSTLIGLSLIAYLIWFSGKSKRILF